MDVRKDALKDARKDVHKLKLFYQFKLVKALRTKTGQWKT
uniref:Uncharacterized protein n=1 Tax=Pithovirus LCPAC304 TaxID=2506594 RepID=A0A481Z887_9VIRU|nr:MAG: hypothetical protein LCPAC304_03300 [Pithovirus LCPAC304]